MRSRCWQIGWVATVFVLVGGCEVDSSPSGFSCSDTHTILDARVGKKVVGTIIETYDVHRTFPDTSSDTREEQKTVLKVVLDLAVQEDGSVKGTGKVTWQRNNRRVYRQTPGVCADGLMIDSNVREWTVDLTGSLFCDNEFPGITASGPQDGGDIPTTLHYHDYGCHAGCSCYDNNTGSSELIRWNSFVARGFVDSTIQDREDRTPPAPYEGEWSVVTDLLVTGD